MNKSRKVGSLSKGHHGPGRYGGLYLCLFILFLWSQFHGSGILRSQNHGLKFSRNYSSEEYRLQPQNWCILQDQRGILHVGNHGGLLQYDSETWKKIDINNMTVRSMAMGPKGTIYIGGMNEIGYIHYTPEAGPKYVSLLETIAENKRNFGSVWRTHATPAGIFFRTSTYLFRWQPQQKKMTILLDSKGDFKFKIKGSFTVNGQYFVHQKSVGLVQLHGDSLALLKGGKAFAAIKVIFMIVPYGDSENKLLIGTRDKGFFLYDGHSATHFPTEVEQYLKDKIVNCGIKLSHSPDTLAIATRLGGVVITDYQGRRKHLLTEANGLSSNNIRNVYEDSQGNLWTAQNEGLSKIEFLSPFFIYNSRSQLPGLVFSMNRNDDGLYAGTSQGLFHLAENGELFTPVPGMPSSCWALLSINENGPALLAATSRGVFMIKKGSIRQITTEPSYVLRRSAKNAGRIWVGTRNTLLSLVRKEKDGKIEWQKEHTYKNIESEIRSIVEDRKGNLWMGAQASGVINATFPEPQKPDTPLITRYGTDDGLPRWEVNVFQAAGHVMVGSNEGLLRFDKKTGKFVPDYTLGEAFSRELEYVFRLEEDPWNSIWFHAKGRNYLAVPGQDGTYKIEKKVFARIPISWQVNAIYPDIRGKTAWFATHKGLVRCDLSIEKNIEAPYSTLIRQVSVNSVPVFYDLPTPRGSGESVPSSHATPIFPYKKRNFRFHFAAPFFENEAATQYRFILEGFDRPWSNWQKATYQDFTNLDTGTYVFRVQAKNIYGQKGRDAIFRFQIKPPWYFTWWAIVIYVLLFLLLFYLAVRWRSQKLVREKLKLEQIIEARTQEIQRKNRQLEDKTLLLRSQAEKLEKLSKAKSHFLASISHEFRTPLTMILGPIEQVLEENLPEGARQKLEKMGIYSKRLLTLITRLLDLSKIDSGQMELNKSSDDIIPFLKGLISNFEDLSRKKNLHVTFQSEKNSIFLQFDSEKFEDIFGNLLSNAVKFTPQGGRIDVSVHIDQQQEEDFPHGSLNVLVKDTGIGIPQDQTPHIFDYFYQVDSHKGKYKGTGIGLALTRELVQLHGGKIAANSREGENGGTEFILRFPMPAPLPAEGSESGITPASPVFRPNREKRYETDTDPHIEIQLLKEAVDKRVRDEKKAQNEKTILQGEAGDGTTILVVEDNPDMRDYIRDCLGPQYTIYEAENGTEGFKMARKIMPDMVISDIMMPEMDGNELCSQLKTSIETSHIPVILLTAKSSEQDQVEGLETGADDYIIKPFSKKTLNLKIKNRIETRRKLREKFQGPSLLEPDKIDVSPLDQRFLKKLHHLIEKNMSDSDFNVEALSDKMEISRVTLNKKVQAITGDSPTHFIRSYRLKRSMQLLQSGYDNVTNIFGEVGFSSSSYFAKCFKEKYGHPPTHFLEKKS